MLLFVCTPNTEKCCSSESDDHKEAAVLRCASVIWSREQIESDKTVSQTEPPRAGSGTGENFFSGTPARARSYRHGSRNKLLGYGKVSWGRGKVRKQQIASCARWPLAASAVNTTKHHPIITNTTAIDDSVGNIIRPFAPFLTAGPPVICTNSPPPLTSAFPSNNIPPWQIQETIYTTYIKNGRQLVEALR